MEKIEVKNKKTMMLSAGDTLVSSGSGSVIVSLLSAEGAIISSKNIKANESLDIEVDGLYLLSSPACSSIILSLIKAENSTEPSGLPATLVHLCSKDDPTADSIPAWLVAEYISGGTSVSVKAFAFDGETEISLDDYKICKNC